MLKPVSFFLSVDQFNGAKLIKGAHVVKLCNRHGFTDTPFFYVSLGLDGRLESSYMTEDEEGHEANHVEVYMSDNMWIMEVGSKGRDCDGLYERRRVFRSQGGEGGCFPYHNDMEASSWELFEQGQRDHTAEAAGY